MDWSPVEHVPPGGRGGEAAAVLGNHRIPVQRREVVEEEVAAAAADAERLMVADAPYAVRRCLGAVN